MTKKLELREIVDVEISRIRTTKLNPNRMSEFEFSQLVDSIAKDGFDEPIKIIPDPATEDGPEEDMLYIVASGEHRLRAADHLGFETIPCVIEEDWDTSRVSAELVRRNLIRGSLDSKKLRELLDAEFSEFTTEEQARILGFEDQDALLRAARIKVQEEEQISTDPDIDNELGTFDGETEFIDGLHAMLSSIFSTYGTDVEANFMAFMLNRRLNLLVRMNSEFAGTLDALVEHSRTEGLDMNEVLENAIRSYLEANGCV